jgi:hypothetical protein
MVALVDGAARFLQSDILPAAIDVQGAHRRVPITAAEQKRAHGPSGFAHVQCVRGIPITTHEGRQDVILMTDHDQIEWIAIDAAGSIGGAARQAFEYFAQTLLFE